MLCGATNARSYSAVSCHSYRLLNFRAGTQRGKTFHVRWLCRSMKPGRMTPGTLIAEDDDGIVALEPTAVIISLETEIAPSGMRPPGASTVPTIVQSSAAW